MLQTFGLQSTDYCNIVYLIYKVILFICFVGIMVRSWKEHSAAMIFTAAFLVIIVITTIAKAVTTMVQWRRMNKDKRQMDSLATSSVYESATRSSDSYEAARTINKLLYGSAGEYAESYRQNDVLY